MGLFSSILNPFGGGGGNSSDSYGGGFNKSSSSSSDSNSNNVTTTTDNSVTTNVDARSYLTNTSTTNNTLSSWLDQSVSEWVDNSQRTTIDVNDSRSFDNSVRSFTDNSARFDVQDSRSFDNSVRAYTDSSQRTTFDVQDSSSRDNSVRLWSDTSQTTTNVTNADSAQIVGINAALLQAVGESQADAAKAIAKMGADGVAAQAEAARDLFTTSSAEASKAWGHTLDLAGEALDKLMTNTRASIGDALTTANNIGSKAVQANPEAAAGANMKIALIGAAAVLIAAFITKR